MKQREIILTPFPFADLSGNKVIPALIVSNNEFNENSTDIIICAITSNIKNSKYSVTIDQRDLEDGKLFETSAVKVENILKINKSLILKTFARLNKKRFSEVIRIIEDLTRQE